MLDSLLELQRLLMEESVEVMDDELLAEIASAAAAGEDVDVLYADEMRLIESSVPLAEAYGELAAMMETAVFTMSQAAQAVSPRDIYLGMLAERVTLSPEQRVAAGDVVDRLAVLLAEERGKRLLRHGSIRPLTKPSPPSLKRGGNNWGMQFDRHTERWPCIRADRRKHCGKKCIA